MAKPASVYEFGSFLLDAPERRLMCRGTEISLTLKVFETLCLLVENAGHLMTKKTYCSASGPIPSSRRIASIRMSLSSARYWASPPPGRPLSKPCRAWAIASWAPSMRSPRKCRTTDRARHPATPHSRQEIRFCVTEDGARIAYATVGAGYPLVKAANWLNHLDYEWESPLWRHWIDELTRHHAFIRYDERGNGLSDWAVADISLEAWVRDLETVVDAAGIEKFDMMGISQGGAVAIEYTVRHPEQGESPGPIRCLLPRLEPSAVFGGPHSPRPGNSGTARLGQERS